MSRQNQNNPPENLSPAPQKNTGDSIPDTSQSSLLPENKETSLPPDLQSPKTDPPKGTSSETKKEPQSVPDKISKVLLPFILFLFLGSTYYYLSVFYMKRDIKIRKLENTPVSAEISPSPIIAGFIEESNLPDSPHTNPTSTITPKNPNNKESPIPIQSPAQRYIPPHKKININTAKADDFVNLPGIGVKKALAIIDYRRKNGKFKKIEDIKKVKGIGKKLYDGFRDIIYIE